MIKLWSHPKHKVLASLSTILCGIALALSLTATTVFPWFTKSGAFTTNPKKAVGSDARHFFDQTIDCTNNYCVDKQQEADFQVVAHWLMLTGVSFNMASFLVQGFIFWPLVVFNKSVARVFMLCRAVDFIGSYCKFFSTFIYIYHSPRINYNYQWEDRTKHFQLEMPPLALSLFSFVIEMLCVLLNILSLDAGARFGLTHEERLAMEKDEVALKQQSRKELRRRSSYIPTPQHTHGNVVPRYASETSIW